MGLKAKIRGVRVLELASELTQISEKGLARQCLLNGQGQDESIYLIPLKEEILLTGKSPAEQVVELWEGQFGHNRRILIDYLKV